MKYQIAIVILGLAYVVLANPQAKVEPKIWENLEESDTTNILVTFKKANTKAAFDRFYALKLTSREAILTTQHAILKDHADIVQADVTAVLKKAAAGGKKHEIAQLWVTNELIVRNVDKEDVELLRNHPDVESLVAEKFLQLDAMYEEGYGVLDNNTVQNQWGVEAVRAPEAWQVGITGQGITVGVIDTGARYTHVVLSPTYRGNDPGETHDYNWFDPSVLATTPSDTVGHGTHVTGSISGTEGIGVAPGSRWISCRGCSTTDCSILDLNECGNFMACPTDLTGSNPQCGRAPLVVNNSWGGGINDPWYDAVIAAWRNAGIVPIFSAGNTGPDCSTVVSPGDRPGAVSVASTQANNLISNFSSVGPSASNIQKPNVAAPGQSIVSASHLTDTGLATASGTSMSAPHIAGSVALILSRRGYLNVDQMDLVLALGSVPHASQGRECNGVSEDQQPNFHAGAGIIDAYFSATYVWNP